MKLISITKLDVIGDADHYWLEFENDGETYTKTTRVSGVVKTVGVDMEQVTRNALYMACIEAERDMAYVMFGDDWRKHVGPMWRHRTDQFAEHCAWKILEFMK